MKAYNFELHIDCGEKQDCPECKRKECVFYNPYNKVVQCHQCGAQVFLSPKR